MCTVCACDMYMSQVVMCTYQWVRCVQFVRAMCTCVSSDMYISQGVMCRDRACDVYRPKCLTECFPVISRGAAFLATDVSGAFSRF